MKSSSEMHLNILKYHDIDSTNSEARRLLEEGTIGDQALIISDLQTKGRGRLGRDFVSPPGSGLYMTLVLRSGVSFDTGRFFLITIASAVSVVRALKEIFGLDAGIKWVNDIVSDGRKLCGILSEGITDPATGNLEFAIVGTGLNIRPPEGGYPEAVRPLITTIYEETVKHSKNTDSFVLSSDSLMDKRSELAVAISENTVSLLKNASEDGGLSLIEEYRRHCVTLGRHIRVYKNGLEGPFLNAYAAGIDDNGGLAVIYDDGSAEVLTSGEVSIRPAGITCNDR